MSNSGKVILIALPELDQLRNWMSSEECRELAAAI